MTYIFTDHLAPELSLNPSSEKNPKKSRRSRNPCLEIITLRIMPHETLKVRLLEFMGTELDNLYVERKEFFSDYCISHVDSCNMSHVGDNFHNYNVPTFLL